MSEPTRWSEALGGATREESELLAAGVAERMPNELREHVWSAISLGAAGGASALGAASAAAHTGAATAETATAAGAATAETATAAGAISKGVVLSLSSVLKGAIAIAVLGGASVAALHVRGLPSTHSPVQPALTHAIRAPSAAASALVPEAESSAIADPTAALAAQRALLAGSPAASAIAGAAPLPPNPAIHEAPAVLASKSQSALALSRADSEAAQRHPSDSSARAELSSRLREESAAVLAIRRTLLAGNAQQALSLLARARTEFPQGALAEEREALSVRALMSAGETAAARQQGAAFLRRFPRSPHARDVRRLLGLE